MDCPRVLSRTAGRISDGKPCHIRRFGPALSLPPVASANDLLPRMGRFPGTFRRNSRWIQRGFNVLGAVARLKTLVGYRHNRSPAYLTAISNFRMRQCLDPRDKIYGILGLLNPHVRSLIRPDYTRPPGEIFTQAALASVATTESLEILSLVHGKRTQKLNIPSFVPDWTAYIGISSHDVVRARGKWLRLHDASGGSPIDLRRATPCEFTTSGVCVDKLASFTKYNRRKVILSACREIAGVDTDTNTASENKTTAFWQTLCGGSIWSAGNQFRNVEGSDYTQYKRWEEIVDDGLPICLANEDMLGFTQAVAIVSALRSFTVTEKGYYGWLSEDVEEGDIVALLSGGKVPYVLRPVNEQERSAENVGGITSVGNDRSGISVVHIRR